jgi:Histidine kinase
MGSEPRRFHPRRGAYALVAGVLALIVIALALLDDDSTMGALDYAAITLLVSSTGTAAVALAVRSQLRASRGAGAMSRARLVAGTALRSMVAATLWLIVVTLAQVVLSDDGAPGDLIALWILMVVLVHGMVGVMVTIVHLEDAHHAREQALAVGASADRARLAALRHQLDPHFLFNSLTTITALVREDPALAEASIAQLAQLLRHSLSTDDASGTVAHELEVVRALTALARARFEDDLIIELRGDLGDAALAAEVLPPFLIQPLVENAIAHGMRTAAPPVRIEISVERCAGGVVIEVVNDGALEGRAGAAPIGLANLRERLELLYPRRHELVLEERAGRVRARMRLTRAA